MTPAKLGVVYPEGGLRRFLDLVGAARTRELFFTGRPIDAETALAWGLVNRVAPAGAAEADALALADEIAANAPLAVRGMKRIMRLLEGTHERGLADAGARRDRRAAPSRVRERGHPRGQGGLGGAAPAALQGRVTRAASAGGAVATPAAQPAAAPSASASAAAMSVREDVTSAGRPPAPTGGAAAASARARSRLYAGHARRSRAAPPQPRSAGAASRGGRGGGGSGGGAGRRGRLPRPRRTRARL